jgi:hypothetical protein
MDLSTDLDRRVCWLIVMCLALPAGHPARARYVSPLAASLALGAGQRRLLN